MAYQFHTTASTNWVSFSEVGSELSFGTGDFTILAKVRPETVTYGPAAQGTILSRDYTAYETYIYQGSHAAYVGGTANAPGTWAIAANAWATVGLRRSGSSLQLYKDGAFGTAATNSAAANGSGAIYLGNRPAPASTLALRGAMQELGIWKGVALTDAEVASYERGFPPHRIRPQSLSAAIRLIRDPVDLRSARTWTFGSNGPAADLVVHNRMYG